MEQGHRSESRSRLAWRETNRQLSQWRPNWRKTAKNLVFSWQRNTRFHRKQPRDYCRWRTGLLGPAGRARRPSLHRAAERAITGLLLLSHRDNDERIRQWQRPSSRIFRTWFRRRAQVGGHRKHLASSGVESDGARTLLGRHIFDQRIFSVTLADKAHEAFPV